MTRLSVNVNKIATLRNARGGKNPDIIQVVKDCEKFGSQGITVHPRPDERHITHEDVYNIAEVTKTDYNIEGFPDDRFLKIIDDIRPEQVTLVPDAPDVVTSNRGWKRSDLNIDLNQIIADMKKKGMKVSLFIDPNIDMVDFSLDHGADRVELYTGDYAKNYLNNKFDSVINYKKTADYAILNDLEVNAGHDLDLINLEFLKSSIPELYEVSIGHALICNSLYYGLEQTIKMYLDKLK